MDIKDNTKQFEENCQYDKDGYLGLIHINEFVPIPLQCYPDNSFNKKLYYAGNYVGTSFRVKATFTNWSEMNKYRIENPELFYNCVSITCARL
jgi:hypothetical protein